VFSQHLETVLEAHRSDVESSLAMQIDGIQTETKRLLSLPGVWGRLSLKQAKSETLHGWHCIR